MKKLDSAVLLEETGKTIQSLDRTLTEVNLKGNDELIPAEEVFKDLYKKHGKPEAILKGARLKENLTQVELAQKLGVSQQHISEMEGGKRPIGKEMSKRFAKVFRTDYRVFL